MTRTLETLTQQAFMMQEIDRAVGDNVMVKGWLDDLSPEEREAFEGFLSQQMGQILAIIEVNRAVLVEVWESIVKGLVGVLENPS